MLRERRHGEGDGEEIKGIPAPGEKGDEEKHPLLKIEQGQQLEWIRSFVHGRLEGGQPRRQIPAHAHVLSGSFSVERPLIDRILTIMHLVVVVGRHVEF